MKIFNDKWNAGWLQWGHEINALTLEAEKKLQQLKNKYPDWYFEQLAQDVKDGKIKAYLITGD